MKLEATYSVTSYGRLLLDLNPKDFLYCEDLDELMDTLHDNMIDYGECPITSTYNDETEFEYQEGIDEFIKEWLKLRNNDSTSK